MKFDLYGVTHEYLLAHTGLPSARINSLLEKFRYPGINDLDASDHADFRRIKCEVNLVKEEMDQKFIEISGALTLDGFEVSKHRNSNLFGGTVITTVSLGEATFTGYGDNPYQAICSVMGSIDDFRTRFAAAFPDVTLPTP